MPDRAAILSASKRAMGSGTLPDNPTCIATTDRGRKRGSSTNGLTTVIPQNPCSPACGDMLSIRSAPSARLGFGPDSLPKPTDELDWLIIYRSLDDIISSANRRSPRGLRELRRLPEEAQPNRLAWKRSRGFDYERAKLVGCLRQFINSDVNQQRMAN
jgi:hypothetical protein